MVPKMTKTVSVHGLGRRWQAYHRNFGVAAQGRPKIHRYLHAARQRKSSPRVTGHGSWVWGGQVTTNDVIVNGIPPKAADRVGDIDSDIDSRANDQPVPRPPKKETPWDYFFGIFWVGELLVWSSRSTDSK